MLVHQQPTIPAAPAVVNPVSAPRKRRRQAPTTGAAEDCFTCRAKGTKCDRRRPYCGPCLDIGYECKGYRTQLTWGVGVASRGKLRGMTLPVSIESNISVAERDRRCAAENKLIDEAEITPKRLRTAIEMDNKVAENSRSTFGEFGMATNHNFLNTRHFSVSNATSSTNGPSRFLHSPTPMTPTSLVGALADPIVVSTLRSPALPYPKHKQEYSATSSFHKPSPDGWVNSHQYSGVIVSPSFPEFERSYTSPSENPYSSSNSATSVYPEGLITNPTYMHPTITGTLDTPSFAPLIASVHQKPQFVDGHSIRHQRSPCWSCPEINSFHQHLLTPTTGNLSNIPHGDNMLGTL